ncbi:hypothetical protein SDC9_187990 [bioreactor metagenome]|uniref:Uncharacterized protein n=1 Tax=bioreactor metagenome TaxID=1076179 RepID=A0A645HYT1_9ZZZZ
MAVGKANAQSLRVIHLLSKAIKIDIIVTAAVHLGEPELFCLHTCLILSISKNNYEHLSNTKNVGRDF